MALADEVTAEIATALAGAQHPLIVTSYLGRDPAAVPELVELCELLAIRVLESMAYHVNFPADHELHAGFQYHTVAQNPVLAQADVILVIDSDVPWIGSVNRPSAGAAIYCVDVDPLKASMNMWHVPARRFAAASARVAVGQIARFVRDHDLADPAVVEARREAAAHTHKQEQAERAGREHPRDDGAITAEYLTACVRRLLEDEDALVLTEVVTNSKMVAEHLRPNRPGSRDPPWRRRAGLGGRRGRRCQARGARPDRRLPGRGRLLPVRRAVFRTVGGSPVRHARADRHLRQPRLGGAQVLHPPGAPGRRRRGGRGFRHQLRARGRSARRGAGGRRLRGHGI